MAYDFSTLTKSITATKDWLIQEFLNIRTGRATTALLDGVRVDSYGSPTPLNQVASVGIEDSRTVRVSPWDPKMVSVIEKAVSDAGLGVGVVSDSKGVRVVFPELTEERRKDIAKVAKSKLEEAKIRIRQLRDEVWQGIQKQEKEGVLSEDEKFKAKEEMERLISEANKALDISYENKEKEILS